MAVELPFPIVPYPPSEYEEHRQKEMKVLALGMPRTGTMSLYRALQELGYTCYHMAEAALDYRNDSLECWIEAIDAKYNGIGDDYRGQEFDRMLSRYDAVTDVPNILFAEELMDAYPNAQIILTTRDVNEWLPSMERTFFRLLSMKRWTLLGIFDTTYTRPYIRLLRSILSIMTDRPRNCTDRDHLAAAYLAHYAYIRGQAQARGRKVLEFRVKDGWGPLCEFLGKETPRSPFPWVNRDDFIVQYHFIGFWLRVYYLLGPVVVGLVVCYVLRGCLEWVLEHYWEFS
ncbi:uncharacterized protein BJX67DRAFT_377527 [Aspergillus lucknowensis]|uniref:P-loop containing nucleoside triphosphate hydrolase protein n=1 Tax=Aspergillus lucknowensis TaxID=176173 RepID=A0ABR4M2K9_9EURO